MRNRSTDEEQDYNPFTANTVEESVNYISNRLSQAIHPLPQIAAIKQSVIGYSFPKEKRFRTNEKEETNEDGTPIFEKGVFSLPDKVDFSSKETLYVLIII